MPRRTDPAVQLAETIHDGGDVLGPGRIVDIRRVDFPKVLQ